ncbi:MAG: (Fe-S)-binding protein [Desulfobacterales bacterium]|nr:(Fe-S)-binding protein [Desulfobacterales bacterium]
MNVTTTGDADTLLYCGCTALGSSPSLIGAAGRILAAAGIPSRCSKASRAAGGLLSAGGFRLREEILRRLSAALRAAHVRTVLVLDADCYRMLFTRTSRFGGDLTGIRIRTIIDPLWESIREGSLPVTPLPLAATYHDPCAFARYCDEIEAPRQILARVLREPLREMAAHGKLSNCCGSGGMLPVVNAGLAEQVSRLRLEEARSTGAEAVVTACPRCDLAFGFGNGRGPGIQMFNLVELVASAAGLQPSGTDRT